jgi:DNA polymerase III delta subunit
MIILIHGKDSYRIKEKVNSLVNGQEIVFDFEEDVYPLLIDSLKQRSLFDSKKIVVTKGLLKKVKSIKDIIPLVGDTTLIIVEDTIDKKYKKIADEEYCFDLLQGAELIKWINARVSGKIHNLAVKKIIEYFNNDLWRISSELDKLACYKDGGMILVDDIELLMRPDIENNIFRTIDAIASKNKKTSLKLLYSHIEKGDAVSYLFSMIFFQFRNLIAVKDAQKLGLRNINKMNPYVFSKTSNQSRSFTYEELINYYSKLVQSDYYIKTGKIDPGIALDLFIFEL